MFTPNQKSIHSGAFFIEKKMYKGTTPTLLFTTEAEVLDLTRATDVYVTLSDMNKKELMTKTDLYIEAKRVGVYLTQEETLSLPQRIQAQINWTYPNDKRMCSQIMILNVSDNLLNKVI